jgi:hypothetical protein
MTYANRVLLNEPIMYYLMELIPPHDKNDNRAL